eukprot:1876332-Amphidinium_carterae.1
MKKYVGNSVVMFGKLSDKFETIIVAGHNATPLCIFVRGRCERYKLLALVQVLARCVLHGLPWACGQKLKTVLFIELGSNLVFDA